MPSVVPVLRPWHFNLVKNLRARRRNQTLVVRISQMKREEKIACGFRLICVICEIWTTSDSLLVWPRRFELRQAALRVVFKARSRSFADNHREDFDRKIWDKNIRAEKPGVRSYLPVPHFPVYVWLRHDRAG